MTPSAAPAVRAIRRAAPDAEVHEVSVKAGHFGIVVGSRALSQTWTTVVDWMFWQEGKGGRPQRLALREERLEGDDAAFEDMQFDFELFYEALARRVGRSGISRGRLCRERHPLGQHAALSGPAHPDAAGHRSGLPGEPRPDARGAAA
ncbi:MAG: hypothetical protein R3B40_12100 [Polyangiales bacterium]